MPLWLLYMMAGGFVVETIMLLVLIIMALNKK